MFFFFVLILLLWLNVCGSMFIVSRIFFANGLTVLFLLLNFWYGFENMVIEINKMLPKSWMLWGS